MNITLRPAAGPDSEFCFRLHRAAMGSYVAAVWGWDDHAQRRKGHAAPSVVRMLLDDEGCFRRFRFADEDRDEVLRDIATDRGVLGAAIPGAASPAILRALVRLGFRLTLLGDEAEAAEHLESAVTMARMLSEHGEEISALLHLATARQYLGDRDRAQALFQEGLDKSAEYGIDREVHFLLHHRARCYAEQGQLTEARTCMAQALALRQQLGDPRFITSSQGALDALDAAKARNGR